MTTFRHDDDYRERVPVEVLRAIEVLRAMCDRGVFVVEAGEALNANVLVVVDAGGRVARCPPGGAPIGVTVHSASVGERVNVMIDESKIGRLA